MLAFAKGHGTLNDFVLVADPDDRLGLSDDDVRFLCDRRAGIGGDGLLRAVRARHIPEWDGEPDLWFMDYRNADSSVAEMCGNGLRVFLRFLKEEGLLDADSGVVEVGTRAGLRSGELLADGRIRVWMGRPEVRGSAPDISCSGRTWSVTGVDVGNPHAVAAVSTLAELDALDLTQAPSWAPADGYPQGVNIEFVKEIDLGLVRMRVFERGVGETLSCGTGTVAVAAAVAASHGQAEGLWTVQVRGGEVEVELNDGQAWLTGPAEIIATGAVRLPGEKGEAR